MYLNWNYTDKYLYLLKICHIHVHVFTSNLLENKCTTACIELNLLIVMARLSFFKSHLSSKFHFTFLITICPSVFPSI